MPMECMYPRALTLSGFWDFLNGKLFALTEENRWQNREDAETFKEEIQDPQFITCEVVDFYTDAYRYGVRCCFHIEATTPLGVARSMFDRY